LKILEKHSKKSKIKILTIIIKIKNGLTIQIKDSAKYFKKIKKIKKNKRD
jgi:hypothetical protein